MATLLVPVAASAQTSRYPNVEACVRDTFYADEQCRTAFDNAPAETSTIAIVGIVAGALVLLVAAFILIRRRRKPTAAAEAEQIEVNKAGVGLAVAGAALMVIASFLPQLEAPGIIPIKQNTLAQNGEWWFIGAAVIAVAATYRVFQQRTRSYAPLVIGVIAIGIAVYDGTGSRLDLVSIATGDSLGPAASPGVGLYAAGVGGTLVAYGGALLAGWGIWPGGKQLPAQRTRTCPDCAEVVLAEARVCKHCGYRLDAPEG